MGSLIKTAFIVALTLSVATIANAQSGRGAGAANDGAAGSSDRTSGRVFSPQAVTPTLPPAAVPSAAQGAQRRGRLTPEGARERLEQRGYTQIGIIEAFDDMYQTRAVRNGQVVVIWIDPETHQYSERRGDGLIAEQH